MSNRLLYVARVLRDQLNDLFEGTTEAPRLRSTLESAAQDILVSRDDPNKKRRIDSEDSRCWGDACASKFALICHADTMDDCGPAWNSEDNSG